MPRRSPRPNHSDFSLNSIADHAAAYAALFGSRIMRKLDRQSAVAREFWRWADDFVDDLSAQNIVEMDEADIDLFDEGPRRARSAPAPARWRALRTRLDAMAASIDPVRKTSRVFELSADFGLDEVEMHLLEFLCSYASMQIVESLWDRVLGGRGGRALVSDVRRLAAITAASPTDVASRLQPTATLRRTGLFTMSRDGHLGVVPRLLRALAEPPDSIATRNLLLGRPQTASLPFAAFTHLGAQLGHLKAVLAGGLAENTRGLQALLYGAPGTGKTELSKTLAQQLGVPIFSVGEACEDGDEPNRAERLGDLRLALRLLEGKRAIILCDEAEDIFNSEAGGQWSSRGARGFFSARRTEYSRAYMHRLLEHAPVPIIFTANDLRGMDQAILRRISVCVEMQVPPANVRARIWREAAESEGVKLAERDVRSLAGALPAAPAVARSAMRTARLAGGDTEMVRMTVQGVLRAMHQGRIPKGEDRVDIDGSLLNADIDLNALADRLAVPGAPRDVSLLLSGPPGSGKSAYVRHLAERMELTVLQRRASDLLGSYVGETEQRIAGAFAEAAASRAFLVFDEADSLLGAREGAQQSWQVSQVNEMLTWMERHEWPVAFTTNFADHLDPAVMRRVLLKVRFGHLTLAQTDAAFRRFFGLEPPAGLAHLDRLTPADFALVRRVAALQGGLEDAGALLAALSREQRAKPGGSRQIGFRSAA